MAAADPVDNEHHVIFGCPRPEHTYARQQSSNLFKSSVASVGHFLDQLDCIRVTIVFTQIRMMHLNLA